MGRLMAAVRALYSVQAAYEAFFTDRSRPRNPSVVGPYVRVLRL